MGYEERKAAAEAQAAQRENQGLSEAVAKGRVEAQEARERLKEMQADMHKQAAQLARSGMQNDGLAGQMQALRSKCAGRVQGTGLGQMQALRSKCAGRVQGTGPGRGRCRHRGQVYVCWASGNP